LCERACDDRVARTESETVIEIERAGPERLGALVAELITIDHHRPHPEDPPVRPEELRREVRRLPLTKRGEDVDGEVERAEQLPASAVAHRHAVLERQEAVVALERQPKVGLDADEDEPEPAPGVADQDVVGIGIRKRVELPLARRHRRPGDVDHRFGEPSRSAHERQRPSERLDEVDVAPLEPTRVEERVVR